MHELHTTGAVSELLRRDTMNAPGENGENGGLRAANVKEFLPREPAGETPVRELKEQVAAMCGALEEVRRECASLRRDSSAQAKRIKALEAGLDAEREGRLRQGESIQELLYELQSEQELSTMSGSESSNHIAYRQLVRRIREVVRREVPRGSTVVVVSKGDEELLRLYGHKAWHFPRSKEGGYAGYYPRTSSAAVVHLEVLRAQGATHLLFPATALWWLEEGKYADFRNYLERRFRCVVRREDACVIFDLREPAEWAGLEAAVAECEGRLERPVVILEWGTGRELSALFPQCVVFSPPAGDEALPYLDKSVDLVAVRASEAAAVAEARRVAREAVVLFHGEGVGKSGAGRDFKIEIEWIDGGASSKLPSVSIIIPVFNQADFTDACLASLRETLPRNFRGEIIVVDDASYDDTPERLRRWAKLDKRIKVVRNKSNAGFLASTTRGVRAATGEIVLFLNNDTVLLPGWLPPLLRVFRDRPDAGAVGGKLLFHDGSLQEAGGIVFRDGSAANFGRGDQEPDGLLYSFVREVDYCSGALLATPRKLFLEIGGFDTLYSPAYYEDTDYCFAVRAKGRRVYFQPGCVVVHIEGGTSGTDLSSGVKHYQVVNHEKFMKKWEKALRRQPARPDYADQEAWKALAVRKEYEE